MLATAQVVSRAMVTQDNLRSLLPFTAGLFFLFIEGTPYSAQGCIYDDEILTHGLRVVRNGRLHKMILPTTDGD
jgi:hypothetical protein